MGIWLPRRKTTFSCLSCTEVKTCDRLWPMRGQRRSPALKPGGFLLRGPQVWGPGHRPGRETGPNRRGGHVEGREGCFGQTPQEKEARFMLIEALLFGVSGSNW